MKLNSGLIEVVNTTQKNVVSSSGTILNNEFIIITSNTIAPFIGKKFHQFLTAVKPNILQKPPDAKYFENHLLPEIRTIYNPSSAENDIYVNRKCEILASFKSQSIAYDSRNTLGNWAIDDKVNSKDLSDILSLFFILIIIDDDNKRNDSNPSQLGIALNQLWDEIKNIDLKKGDEIYMRSSPFGSRLLIDSYSRGIISNFVGNELSLLVSDCPVTPGSEGSPVFNHKSNKLIGIVISSSCWWKGDWTGLTLIADIRVLLCEILKSSSYNNKSINSPQFGLIASIESSLLQVYSGSNWGTAIIINTEFGILVTNSHVVDAKSQTKIYHNGKSCQVVIIFQNPDNTRGLDIAVLKCDSLFLKSNNLKALHSLKKHDIKLGDEVFCSGFPLFPKEVATTPSLSKGSISQVNDWMLKTTCAVNPGMSGGAVLTPCGELLGIIVCNVKIPNGTVYPRLNLALPYYPLSKLFEQFFIDGDQAILSEKLLNQDDFTMHWQLFRGKL